MAICLGTSGRFCLLAVKSWAGNSALPQCASLRDHTQRMLYWRTPLTARWQGVNVSEAAAASGPRILPVFEGWQDAWSDATDLVS